MAIRRFGGLIGGFSCTATEAEVRIYASNPGSATALDAVPGAGAKPETSAAEPSPTTRGHTFSGPSAVVR